MRIELNEVIKFLNKIDNERRCMGAAGIFMNEVIDELIEHFK